tara:strand:+ start:719 stop:940 length:222 start_codon:yes stop_codon:yes gene_type:complete
MNDTYKPEIDTYIEHQIKIDLILNRTFGILKETNDSMNELTFEEWCKYMSFKFCMVLEKYPQLEELTLGFTEE